MEIAASIIAGDCDGQLESIIQQCRLRQTILDSQSAQELQDGDRVILQRIRPKYLTGATGVFVGHSREGLRIQLDRRVGRFSGVITCEPMCARKV